MIFVQNIGKVAILDVFHKAPPFCIAISISLLWDFVNDGKNTLDENETKCYNELEVMV